jgi:hypothetical protein
VLVQSTTSQHRISNATDGIQAAVTASESGGYEELLIP